MKITRKEVEHVARLARLESTEEEKELFTGQLDEILAYVDKLNELDTDGIVPTSPRCRWKMPSAKTWFARPSA